MDLILRVPVTTWSVSLTVVFEDEKTGDNWAVCGLDNDFATALEDGAVLDVTEYCERETDD